MNTSTWVVAVVALIIGFFLGYGFTGQKATGEFGFGTAASTSPATSEKAIALRADMRKLWTDHTVWTRDYIIAAVAGAPDQDAAAARLLKNQDDIGNAVAVYYGAGAGNNLTELLKSHIQIAVDLIKAAKANDTAGMNAQSAKWQENANQIADFLGNANPNWSQADLRAMMKKHLETTTAEVQARLKKDWTGDVKAYDAVYDHILEMADALSDGIIKQFPNRF